MKRYRRIPAFEQFEAKRPLAADVCEHESEEAPPVVESSSLGAEESEGLSFRAPAAFQLATSSNEAQALSSEEEDENEDEEVNGQETDDEEETDDTDEESDESDDEEDVTEEDESDEEEEDDSDETEDNDDESDDLDEDETDDEDTDESDEDDNEEEDDSDDDDMDENDEGEILLTANLTGTGSGTAEFESEMEDGGTERELTIEVMGTTPGTHEVKINSIAVGNIVVGSDGTGTLELSSDPDDDETQLPDGVTITGGSTVMVGTVLMGTFPASLTAVMAPSAASSSPTVDEVPLAASYSEPVVVASEASPSAESVVFQAKAVDVALADLLLAIAYGSADDELESTEFVGRSERPDSTDDAEAAAHDAEGELSAGA